MYIVYLVMKNVDFTEGRGPMLVHKAFTTFKLARDYVMEQSGMFGSKQEKVMAPYHHAKGFKTNFYNGYDIVELEVKGVG